MKASEEVDSCSSKRARERASASEASEEAKQHRKTTPLLPLPSVLRSKEKKETKKKRTHLELPVNVAADGHGAPYGRDVGLSGEDLAGHLAERL